MSETTGIASSGAGIPTGPPSGTPPGPGENPGDFIGPYELLSVISSGGQGVVWLAERRDPMLQRVALKVILPGTDSREVVARFEQERQALALMDHPNVARVFDGGATPAGRPYFVMELVRGEPLTRYCDKHRLTIRQRLELFIPVCEAVQHAHMKGIIHRDLKPGNVLVEVAHGRPIPKVIDFGIAKAIRPVSGEREVFTRFGQFMGTPEYMSPEQAEMGVLDIDTRADVYSLGVMLYELLTGMLPFDPQTLRRMADDEIRRVLREVDPPTPSRRLTTLAVGSGDTPPDTPNAPEIARRRQAHIDAIVRELRRELEWVPLKAMRKDRSRRYASAAELGADIRNYLEGRPLVAGPESSIYRARKILRRHAGLFTAVSAVFLALVAGVIATSLALVRARDAEHAAKLDRAAAELSAANERAAGLVTKAAEERERLQRLAADQTIEWLGSFAWRMQGGGDKPVGVTEFLGTLDKALDENSMHADPARQASLRVLASGLYQAQGEIEQAVTVLQKGLDELTQAGAGETQDADHLRAYLAFALVQLGPNRSHDAAEALGGAVERSRRRTDGLPLRLLVLHANGAVCNLLGDWRQAEDSLTEAMRIQEGLGTVHLVPLDDMTDLLSAVVEHYPTRRDEAMDLARNALDLRRQYYGPRHLKVAISLNTIGIRLHQRAELVEADAAFREALDIDASRPWSPTWLTASIQHNFAALLRDREMVKEAIMLESRALETRRRVLKSNSLLVADSLDLLGWLYTDDRDFEAATKAFDEALTIREQSSEGKETSAATLTGQATLLVLTGNADKAVPLAQRAVRLREAGGKEANWLLWNSRSVLGIALAGIKNHPDAEPLIVGAADAAMKIRPLPARPRRVIVERAAAFYEDLGQAAVAADWRAKLSQIHDGP